MRILAVAIVAALCAAACTATQSDWPPMPSPCWSEQSGGGGDDCLHRHNANPGVVPNITLYTGAPVFVKSVANGSLYLGGTGDDTFNIVHLWGGPNDDYFSMGYAYGQLLPEEFADMFSRVIPWLVQLLEGSAPWLPQWLAKLVVDLGAPVVLDLLKDLLKANIPANYLEEWKGIAAGCKAAGGNCTVDDVARVSLFAQLSKAACTAFAAHDKATVGGAPQHLRCLDFNASSYVADFSTVTVYHYATKPQYMNFGWSAMTDCLSCSNDVPMTMGEKKWGGHNALIPTGLPWQMMLRQSLEYSNLTALNAYIVNKSTAPVNDNPIWPSGDINTVAFHIVVADGKSNQITGWELGYNYSKQFQWNTSDPSPTHPNYENIVYWPKNSRPSTMCPADMITSQYGKIDANWMANYYAYGDMTGDTQIVAWDHATGYIYYANSRKSTVSKLQPLCAYFRTRIRLDSKALYAEKAPTV